MFDFGSTLIPRNSTENKTFVKISKYFQHCLPILLNTFKHFLLMLYVWQFKTVLPNLYKNWTYKTIIKTVLMKKIFIKIASLLNSLKQRLEPKMIWHFYPVDTCTAHNYFCCLFVFPNSIIFKAGSLFWFWLR